MKRINLIKTFFLAVVLLLPSLMFAASFTYSYRGIDFKCRIKNGEVSVYSFNMDAPKVVVPAHVKDPKGHSYPVTSVDFYAEASAYKTQELVIEKGIVEIEEYCFSFFKKLHVIYIPSTVERIGKKAFNPKNMPTFKMPSSISEEDLRKGLAIYPKVQESDPFEDLNLDAYDAAESQQDIVAQQNIVEKPKVSKAIPAGTSDVDYNIPATGNNRDNTFCIIIANEKYQQAPVVDYAAIDGATFKRYCTNTLGIPDENIRIVTNANYLGMQEQFDWLKKIADVFGNDANFIVYYAGHGIPSDDGTCYLLPVDGNPAKSNNGYSLKKLYDLLGSITTQSALVLIDACFSGNDRNDVSMLGSDRGVVRKLKQEKVGGNVVVMSAASNTETALPYEEKGHGMFTYFLLKKLQETKGKVTYGDLYDYIHKQVLRRTTVSKSKTQTPSVTCSSRVADSWKELNF